jgi:Mlc titration factor MtfA (ptsG expression regulator)
MRHNSISRLAIIMAVAALPAFAVSPRALAQTSAPAPSTSSTAQSNASSNGSASGAPELSKPMREKVNEHIDQLHAELQITASEASQWDQFAQVMRDNAAQMEQAFTARSTNLGTMSAMQNMQSYAQLAQLHATNMQKLASTFQSLYNTFPQSQKQLADEVFRTRHQNTPPKP